MTNRFGWYYLLDVSLFVAFCIIFSPIGKNKLRKPAKKLNFIFLSFLVYNVIWRWYGYSSSLLRYS
nr:hypothetical protein [Bacillus velezensis]